MVKLVFLPTGNDEIVVESISSKKIEKNLNPFSEEHSLHVTPEQPSDFIAVKDIIGLGNCAYILHTWYINPAKILLLVGPTGCGKTTLVESYCKENGIQVYSVKSSDSIKSKKELLKEIFTFADCSTTNFFKKSNNKKLILIDEYQNGQNDILSITDINNLNLLRNKKTRVENKKELKTFLGDLECPSTLPPILVISADSKGSKLSELKKIHEVYYIQEIPPFSLKKWITSIHTNLNDEIITEIISKCKSDKRLILNTANFISKGEEITLESFYKDSDLSIASFLDIIFQNNENFFNIFKIYETDGFMISNLVHENYLEYNDDIDAIANSADAISFGETLFSDNYESSKTFSPELHCLHSMYIPSYYSRSDKPNKNVRVSCINNRYNIFLNNMKIMDKINNKSSSKLSIFDILYIKKFLNQGLVKTKILTKSQEDFIKNTLLSLGKSIEKLELIYKHFSEFNEKESKPKNFTLKFKEKIQYYLQVL